MGCWNGDEADLRRCLGQALVASSEKAAHVGAKHGHVGLIKVVTLDLVKDGLSATQSALGPGAHAGGGASNRERARKAGSAVEQAREELFPRKQPMLFTKPE